MDSVRLDPLESLQSYNHSQLLDVVDQLRALGLSKLLPLPQLIVCGDQSSGKSSVLEAISGVPFPKKDNLCTRFATEVILRRSPENEQTLASVSIRPGQNRSESDRAHLARFDHSLTDVSELPATVQKAKEAMGLGSIGGNAFSTDVLRLEVTGPRMPQLTIVDLPGLIHSENRFQTSEDVELVSSLVHSYMAQKRSVILAVVSAKNDYANQIVLTLAKKVDRTGQRTLGIITKPDTLHPDSDSEKSFLGLAKNVDVVFKLGWQVIRNLDGNETLQEFETRDAFEENFFQTSNWRNLGRSSWGAASLRSRLSEVLFDQITHELPHLMDEIESCKETHQDELNRLGRSRETEEDQRLYLAELNQKIYDICRAGCDGNYDDAFFREQDESLHPHRSRRIRAVLQNEGLEFATELERDGSRWHICEKTDIARNKLSRDDAIVRVMSLLKRSRGRELPGTFNPMLISELFQEYSQPWEGFSKIHVFEIWQQASKFLETVLHHYADESVFEMYTRLVLSPELDRILVSANSALAVLFEEQKQHATTFNHYFTDNVTAARNERQKKHMTRILQRIFTNQPKEMKSDHIPWLVGQLVDQGEPDMDRSTAEEVLDKMEAYYKVAIKRLIDNIPILVIESVIVKRVLNLIQPVNAWKMDINLVREIAGESEARRTHRQQLTDKVNILANSERICKRYATRALKTPSTSEVSEVALRVEDDDDISSVGDAASVESQVSD